MYRPACLLLIPCPAVHLLSSSPAFCSVKQPLKKKSYRYTFSSILLNPKKGTHYKLISCSTYTFSFILKVSIENSCSVPYYCSIRNNMCRKRTVFRGQTLTFAKCVLVLGYRGALLEMNRGSQEGKSVRRSRENIHLFMYSGEQLRYTCL